MILMNDFKAEPDELRTAMVNAATRVLGSGWYILGNEVSSFERLWADACGSARGVGVGNGMDAIEIALRCLDIGQGDEVITTPMTAFATVLAIIRAGATPVLADIDPKTALLSLKSVERCITAKTKAVLLVHLYGQVRSMSAWVDFCKNAGLYLVEDCAQAHLASLSGKMAGSFGVAGAYSFYPTKNLGAPGDAGMLVTNDVLLADRAARYRNYGQNVRYHHSELGMNSRLDELQATILMERYKWLHQFTERRRYIANTYQKNIRNVQIRQLADSEEQFSHSYHLYVVTSKNRDELQAHLHANQIQSLCHYPVPIHQQVPCKKIRRDHMGLKASEDHAETCLSLPCHPQMTDIEIAQVVDAVNSFKAN